MGQDGRDARDCQERAGSGPGLLDAMEAETTAALERSFPWRGVVGGGGKSEWAQSVSLSGGEGEGEQQAGSGSQSRR